MFKSKVFPLLFIIIILFTSCDLNSYYSSSDIKGNYDMASFEYLKDSFKSNNIIFTFKDFEGFYTLCRFEGNGISSLSLYYNVNIDSGNFKIIFIDPDNKIIKKINLKEYTSDSLTIDLNKSGIYRLKIVGDSCYGNFQFSLSTNNTIITFTEDKIT